MEEFNEEEIKKLAKLCRIECTEEEKRALSTHMASILKYVRLLDEVDTQGVDPCFCVLETLTNIMREDEARDLLPRDQFLANAPSHVGGMVRVPPIIKSAEGG